MTNKRFTLAFAVWLACTPFCFSSATELGDLAASMAPGSWAELDTNDLDDLVGVSGFGVNRGLFEYSDNGVWDPAGQQFFFMGGGHQAPKRFIVYSAATNTWSQLPDPPWFPSYMMHGYDHSAIDAAGGYFFHHPANIGSRRVHRYDIVNQTWDYLPNLPGYVECCRGVDYFPELNSLMVATVGNLYRYNFATGAWSLAASGQSMGGYENFAEYSAGYRMLIYGGGRGNSSVHRIDESGTATRLNNAPIPLGITFAVVTSDPVSGDYLVIGQGRRLYSFDPVADNWTEIDPDPPLRSGPFNLIAAPVDTHGVAMFVGSYSYNRRGEVWLYKHTASAPDNEAPGVMLTQPADGSDVSGTVTLVASATDDVAVAGVQFTINGSPYGNEDTTAPYQMGWNAQAEADGPYTVGATARDAAGNGATAATISVNVLNPVVDQPPSAEDQSVSTPEGTPIDITLTGNDPEGSPLTYTIETRPGNGNVQLNGDVATYTPTAAGMDSFTFSANDGALDSNVATVTIDVTPVPAGGVVMETLVRGDISNADWTIVPLVNTYSTPVIVCTPNYDVTMVPLVTRLDNVGTTDFRLRVDRADGSTETIAGVIVHCVVVEAGTYTEAGDGVNMEAVRYTSTVTDGRGSWTGEVRSYANTYTEPVVVGQVMSYNDDAFSTFWARGGSRSSPPTATVLRTGKQVAEDSPLSRENETIGYIVIESGSGVIGTTGYSAGVGDDTIRGFGNGPPFAYALGIATPITAVVSVAGMDGGNGGWPVLYGATPFAGGSLGLGFDEDQVRDAERNHTTEQAAYIVFDQ